MILTLKELCERIAEERKGKIVVFTPGTFDCYHPNHVRFLLNAKQQGDILVVGVKSDKCARKKGKNRPVYGERGRMFMVDNTKGVDYVVRINYDPFVVPEVEYDNQAQKDWLIMFQEVFRELKPDKFYHEINPSLESARDRILALYNIKNVSANRLEGFSTSGIIEKIRKMD